MEEYAKGDLLLSYLFEVGATSAGGSAELPTVIEAVVPDSSQLSAKANLAVSIDRLTTRGLVTRAQSRDGTVSLYLTDRGVDVASDVHESLAGEAVTVPRDEATRSVRAVADDVEEAVAAVAAACTDGVFYRSEGPADELIDREAEREEWEATVRRSTERGEGSAVVVSGPQGIGKTTLVDAFVTELTSSPTIDVHRVESKQRDEPYYPLRQLVEKVGGATAVFEVGARTVGDGPAQTGSAELTDSYEAGQTGLFYEITRELEPDDGHRVLVLEDVHRTDLGTRSYLEYLGDRIEDLPVVLLCTSTPTGDGDVVSADGPMDHERVTHLEPERFTRGETAQMIRQTVGRRDVPDEFVDLVYGQSGGIPLYVELVIEELLETEALDPDFRWYPTADDDLDVATAIEGAVSRQLDAFDADVRELLTWAALCEEPVDTAVLEAVSSQPPKQFSTILDSLTSAGVLEREPDGALLFTNTITKDVAQSHLTEGERRTRHRRIAEELLSLDGSAAELPDRRVTKRVAYHYRECGDERDAAEWYEKAARNAASVYAYKAAIRDYRTALTLARETDADETLLSVVDGLAEIYCLVGEYDQASQYAQFLEDRVEGAEDPLSPHVRWLQATIANVRGDFEAARERSSEGLASSQIDTETECRLLSTRAEAQRMHSDYEDARETAREALTVAERGDYHRDKMEAYVHLAKTDLETQNYESAVDHARAGLDLCEEHGYKRGKIRLLRIYADTKRSVGEFEEANDAASEALALSREIQDKYSQGRLLHSLGNIVLRAGKLEEAIEYQEDALDLQQMVGDRYGQAASLNSLAVIHNNLGNWEQAAESWRRALSIGEEMNNRNFICGVSYNLGEHLRKQGKLDEAIEQFETVIDLVNSSEVEQTEAESLSGLATVQLRKGQYDHAIEFAERGLAMNEADGFDVLVPGDKYKLGDAHFESGLYDDALAYYEDALGLSRELGVGHEICDGLTRLGATAREQERYDAARDYFDRAGDLFDDVDHIQSVIDYNLESAHLHCDLAEYDVAREFIGSARDAVATVDWPYYEGRVELQEARLQFEMGDIEAARRSVVDALDTFRECTATHYLARAQLLAAAIAAERGNVGRVHELARDVRDSFAAVDPPQDDARVLRDASRRYL